MDAWGGKRWKAVRVVEFGGLTRLGGPERGKGRGVRAGSFGLLG